MDKREILTPAYRKALSQGTSNGGWNRWTKIKICEMDLLWSA